MAKIAKPRGRSIYQRANGTWATSFTRANGKRQSIYGKTDKEVEIKLGEALKADAEGRAWGQPNQTVAQYLRWWLEEDAKPTVRATTYERYRSCVVLHILPELGNVRLSQLAPQHLRALYNRKSAAGLAGGSVHLIHAVLQRALGQAVKYELVTRNVTTLVDAPKLPHTEVEPLSPAQTSKFFAGIVGERNEPLYMVASLGLRRGEVTGLQWSDIDFTARTLRVRRSLQRVNRESEGELPYGQRSEQRLLEPKTAKSWRTIPLPSFALEALRTHRVRQLEERLQLAPIYQDQNLVFAQPDGQPIYQEGLSREFQDTLARLGLPRKRFHDLRHGAASLMSAQGATMKEVSATLGHSSIAITMNLYAHLFPEAARAIADRMQDWYENGVRGGVSSDQQVSEQP